MFPNAGVAGVMKVARHQNDCLRARPGKLSATFIWAVSVKMDFHFVFIINKCCRFS